MFAFIFLLIGSSASVVHAETLYEKTDKGAPTVILRTKPQRPQLRTDDDKKHQLIMPSIQLDLHGGKVIHGSGQSVRPPHHAHPIRPTPSHRPTRPTQSQSSRP